jgi:hypothetical protein
MNYYSIAHILSRTLIVLIVQYYGYYVCKIPRSYPSLNLYHCGKHDSTKHSFTHCYMQTYSKPFTTMHMLEIKRTTW